MHVYALNRVQSAQNSSRTNIHNVQCLQTFIIIIRLPMVEFVFEIRMMKWHIAYRIIFYRMGQRNGGDGLHGNG